MIQKINTNYVKKVSGQFDTLVSEDPKENGRLMSNRCNAGTRKDFNKLNFSKTTEERIKIKEMKRALRKK